MQLPGMDFYISNKAFIFLFFFSLDPPNSSHYISRTVWVWERGRSTGAGLSFGGTGVADCSQEAVQEERL